MPTQTVKQEKGVHDGGMVKRCNDDIKKIDKISSIVMPISLNLPESVKSLIESSIKTITEKADELWE